MELISSKTNHEIVSTTSSVIDGPFPMLDSTTATALGLPTYDFIGVIQHKQRFLWRRRTVATQGRCLLYFDNPEMPPKYIIDFGANPAIELEVAQNGKLMNKGDEFEWHQLATTFSLVGPGLPDGDTMHFQAQDADDCRKWCNAIRMAINGRCERCAVIHAYSRQHKFCFECARVHEREKEHERQIGSIVRMRKLMGLETEDPASIANALEIIPVLGNPGSPKSGRRPAPIETSAYPQCGSGASPTHTNSNGPTPTSFPSRRVLEPLESSPSNSIRLIVTATPRTGSDTPGSAAPELPLSPSSILRRSAGRIPGLLPHLIDRLPKKEWGHPSSPSHSRSPKHRDSTGTSSTCSSPTHQQMARRCGLCRHALECGEMVTTLACSHLFHFECIRETLMRQAVCPTCDAEVVLSEEAATALPAASGTEAV